NQTKVATIAIAEHNGPVYLRFGRPKVPVFTSSTEPFRIGKAWHIHSGNHVSIFCTGHLVWKSIEAARVLEAEGITVDLINLHTIKPLDEAAIIASAKKTGAVVTAEEHQINGGMGSLVAQVLARHCPTPMTFVGVNDSFGESGTPDQLMKKYGLEADDVVRAARALISSKAGK
ncbi:MAG: transketolase family protein, partial [Flavobacteriales bacterium]|nr:transketolase family protein [Flavobacteriales bacterium]